MNKGKERIKEPVQVYQGKKLHLELLKIIAVILVVYIHTDIRGMFRWMVVDGIRTQSVYMMMAVFARMAVPVFFMASGAVLLGREEPLKVIFKKRVSRYVLVLILISALFLTRPDLDIDPVRSVGEFFRVVYSSQVYWHLWFLYSYIGLMLMLPILRKLVKVLNQREYLYIAFFYVLFNGIIPMLELLLGRNEYHINNEVTRGFFSAENSFYFLMGYYMEYVMPKTYRNKKTLILGMMVSLACMVINTVVVIHYGTVADLLTWDLANSLDQCLTVAPACTLYLMAQMLFERFSFPEWVYKGILWIGGTTFGIYLLDPFLRTATEGVYVFFQPILPAIPTCLIWVFASFLLGILVVALLKKLPVLKKLL